MHSNTHLDINSDKDEEVNNARISSLILQCNFHGAHLTGIYIVLPSNSLVSTDLCLAYCYTIVVESKIESNVGKCGIVVKETCNMFSIVSDKNKLQSRK